MKTRLFLSLIATWLLALPAAAQSWRWSDPGPYYRSDRYERGWRYDAPRYRYPGNSYGSPWRAPASLWDDEDDDDDDRPRRRPQREGSPLGPKLMDGGERPPISPMPPQRVAYESRHAPGTIIIDTAGRQLLLLESGGSALRYPISVGREGFTWTGEEKVSRIAEWPDWHPPAEMRERDPKLPEKMTGGLKNPLGAKAIYLGNTLYRIHGTNDAKSIGRASSSGCFRMLNGHVVDLADRVRVGAKVVVVSNLRAAEQSIPGRKG